MVSRKHIAQYSVAYCVLLILGQSENQVIYKIHSSSADSADDADRYNLVLGLTHYMQPTFQIAP